MSGLRAQRGRPERAQAEKRGNPVAYQSHNRRTAKRHRDQIQDWDKKRLMRNGTLDEDVNDEKE